MLTTKIFLASASELRDDRKDFEVFVNRKNKEWLRRGAFLSLQNWEDSLDSLTRGGLQTDRYDEAVRNSDIFVLLCWSRLGKYSKSEFEIAYESFINHGKPAIYTYFKNLDASSISDPVAASSRARFERRLEKIRHYKTEYRHSSDLLLHFSSQLEKLSSSGVIQFPEASISESDYLSLVTQLTAALVASTQAIESYARSVQLGAASGPNYSDDLANKARAQLIDLVGEGKQLRQRQQARLVQELDVYLELPNPHPGEWQPVLERVAATTEGVKAFLDLLAKQRGEFVLQSAYDVLIETTAQRLFLLERIRKLPPPQTGDEIKAIRGLSTNYKKLLKAFQGGISGLQAYLADFDKKAEQERQARHEEDRRKGIEWVDALIAEAKRKAQHRSGLP